MEKSFDEDPKIPRTQASPSTNGGSEEELYSRATFSAQNLENFPAMSLPAYFGNPEPRSSEESEEVARNIRLEEEVASILSHIQLMEDGSSMFKLPLASVETQFPTPANAVGQLNPWSICSPTFTGLGTVDAASAWIDLSWPPHFSKNSLPQPMMFEKPAQNFFQFPELSFYSARVAAEPFLKILCNQPYNLVRNLVLFNIEVHDLPTKVEVDAMMFEIFVTTPDGKKHACFLDAYDNSTFKTFIGSFWAVEDGLYELMAKLLIPSMKLGNSSQREEIIGSLTIPVSRNYSEDCLKESLLIQCEFSDRYEYTINGGPPSWSRADTGGSHTSSTHSGHFPQKRQSCKLWGLTADTRTNNIFYTDRAANEVTCVHPSGRVLLKFGPFQLRCPTGISYDNQHRRLAIADKDGHRICFFTMDGQYISSFGTMGYRNGTFNYPWDVTVSPDGQHIAVTDSKNRRIQLFDRFGNFLNKYSIFEKTPLDYKTQLEYPRGICFDEKGENIYVTDFNAQNVLRIPLECNRHYKMIPNGKLRRPNGIAVDWAGNLLFADSGNNCIRHVSPKRDLIANITHLLDKSMEYPVNVTTLAGDFVAVLEGNGKIHIF